MSKYFLRKNISVAVRSCICCDALVGGQWNQGNLRLENVNEPLTATNNIYTNYTIFVDL